MTRYIMRKLTKGRGITDPDNRARICSFAGFTGIICNLLLFILKLGIGTTMKSIAIISDAFNNLSDTGSSLVTIIGAKLSRKKPDREHPFGHGRYEYIASLIVSFIIILVGIELLKGSANKIFNPEKIVISLWLVVFLCLSIPLKFWLFCFNRTIGNEINSSVVKAAAKDNLNDVVATSAVILTAVIGNYLNFPLLDGIIGLCVSVMIIYSGIGITVDTIGLLLGSPPSPEITERIRAFVLETDGVVGVHDLIVHDYGPGRVIASIHAEVPDDCNIVEIHEVIDALEHKISNEMGIHIVIHMDPISVDCEYTSKIKLEVQKIVKSIDERMNIHDFRMVDGSNNINLIFDIEVPADYSDAEQLKDVIQIQLTKLDKRFNSVINIDIIYS